MPQSDSEFGLQRDSRALLVLASSRSKILPCHMPPARRRGHPGRPSESCGVIDARVRIRIRIRTRIRMSLRMSIMRMHALSAHPRQRSPSFEFCEARGGCELKAEVTTYPTLFEVIPPRVAIDGSSTSPQYRSVIAIGIAHRASSLLCAYDARVPFNSPLRDWTNRASALAFLPRSRTRRTRRTRSAPHAIARAPPPPATSANNAHFERTVTGRDEKAGRGLASLPAPRFPSRVRRTAASDLHVLHADKAASDQRSASAGHGATSAQMTRRTTPGRSWPSCFALLAPGVSSAQRELPPPSRTPPRRARSPMVVTATDSNIKLESPVGGPPGAGSPMSIAKARDRDRAFEWPRAVSHIQSLSRSTRTNPDWNLEGMGSRWALPDRESAGTGTRGKRALSMGGAGSEAGAGRLSLCLPFWDQPPTPESTKMKSAATGVWNWNVNRPSGVLADDWLLGRAGAMDRETRILGGLYSDGWNFVDGAGCDAMRWWQLASERDWKREEGPGRGKTRAHGHGVDMELMGYVGSRGQSHEYLDIWISGYLDIGQMDHGRIDGRMAHGHGWARHNGDHHGLAGGAMAQWHIGGAGRPFDASPPPAACCCAASGAIRDVGSGWRLAAGGLLAVLSTYSVFGAWHQVTIDVSRYLPLTAHVQCQPGHPDRDSPAADDGPWMDDR
ncbi:hypothetical protein L226DRAFT_562319 [Lentinus tigrinus ALCF2SS1-7]|uniref:uncharacterized protein n=1 Tax=Lentinus tigrinus ALCF2SS1-7 TaxID=1328758 RepID=UPI001165D8BF|nr:hypothetical protein L226DRAFT_562319 [Lentinus tigrinus ALCF2SS1-7]